MEDPKFYEVRTPKLWADYGPILIHGLFTRRPEDGCIQLERTGPFIPPITLPKRRNVIVTDAFRRLFASAGWKDAEFKPVIKTRIVELHWEAWDRSLARPPQYPPSGEPEGYALDYPHSQAASDQMGDLWELVLPVGGHIEVRDPDGSRYLPLISWRGYDIFKSILGKQPIVTERGREWLAGVAGEWVSFRDLPSGN